MSLLCRVLSPFLLMNVLPGIKNKKGLIFIIN